MNRLIFRYNAELNDYQELEVENDAQLRDHLDSDKILLFVDPHRKRVWIWHGRNTTTKMKFIAAKLVPTIRDRYGIGFKIAAIDEGSETLGFKILIGLEKESDYTEAQILSAYEGTKEDLELLESLSVEKILLLLKKTKDRGKSTPLDHPEEETENKLYCKYCGSRLSEGKIICHVCGKMVI